MNGLARSVSIQVVLVSALLSFLSSCTPGISRTLQVQEIQEVKAGDLAAFSKQPTLRVKEFDDNREKIDIARVGDNNIIPDGNLGAVVSRAVERSLRASGARLSQFSGTEVRGSIEEWYVHVSPSFPVATLAADATIVVEIAEQGKTPSYRGRYSGNSEMQHPVASESKIQDALGEAMRLALLEMLEDKKLVGKLEGVR